MKAIQILVIGGIAGLCCTAAAAQGIAFSKMAFEEAKAEAAKTNKNIFVDVMASWCAPCKQMDEKVFSKPEVGTYFNANYVCLKLDGEKELQHGVFEKIKPGAYPTFLFLDNKGNVLDIKVGYMEAPAFIEAGKNAATSDLAARHKKYEDRWESGERNLELIKEYVFGILSRIHPEQVIPCVNSYLATLTEVQLKSAGTAELLRGFMFRSTGDGLIFTNQMKYADTYAQYVAYPEFEVSMYRLVVRTANAALLSSNSAGFEEHMRILKKSELKDKQMYLDIIDAEKDINTHKYKAGFDKMMAFAERYGPSHPYLYGQFFYSLLPSGYILNAITDEDDNKRLVALAEKAFEFEPCKTTADYLGAAYAKAGDYKKAYEIMAARISYGEPKLPGIMYKWLGLKTNILTSFGQLSEGAEMKKKKEDLKRIPKQ